MPKFIGHTIKGAVRIADNAEPRRGEGARMRLAYRQAILLPPSKVMCSLDTTDTGSRGSYAKRWFRFFAKPEAVLACQHSTRIMVATAELYLGVSAIVCLVHEDCQRDWQMARDCFLRIPQHALNHWKAAVVRHGVMLPPPPARRLLQKSTVAASVAVQVSSVTP